jgi:iron(III) transport system permease protein
MANLMANLPQVLRHPNIMTKPGTGAFVMVLLLPVLALYLIWPMILILSHSFNSAPIPFFERRWSLDNWAAVTDTPFLLESLFNSFLIWFLVAAISFPIAISISWALARVKMPFSYPLEYLFWVAYMVPNAAIAWILLLDPAGGFINVFLQEFEFISPVVDPFLDEYGQGPLDIFSLQGIVWVHLMGNGIALKVMLLTPAFRNMDMAMEEAARVGGASNLRTMLRVTTPLMASQIILVLALQLLRVFQSFETEFLLGRPIKFYVYSTLIYDKIRSEIPDYGAATTLASMTLVIILLIVPLQRWILNRRRYTTITGSFRPGLIDLGAWKWLVFGSIVGLHVLLTAIQLGAFVLGSFMTRTGFFNITPAFTLNHWRAIWGDDLFIGALKTTLTLSVTAAFLSPLLFSILAYIMVRTKWPGRSLLDWMIWGSGAIPGLLSGLGLLLLFLGTPGLSILYGTIWALLLVVIMGGNTTGVNITKGALVQVGFDMEEAARVSGAGWARTYFKIWLPILSPTMILLGTLNFVGAAGATSSVILLASRETITLSILALEFASPELAMREAAAIITLHITVLTLGFAMIMRRLGAGIGIRHR